MLKSDVLTEGNAFVSAEAFTLLLSEEGAKPVRRTEAAHRGAPAVQCTMWDGGGGRWRAGRAEGAAGGHPRLSALPRAGPLPGALCEFDLGPPSRLAGVALPLGQ